MITLKEFSNIIKNLTLDEKGFIKNYIHFQGNIVKILDYEKNINKDLLHSDINVLENIIKEMLSNLCLRFHFSQEDFVNKYKLIYSLYLLKYYMDVNLIEDENLEKFLNNADYKKFIENIFEVLSLRQKDIIRLSFGFEDGFFRNEEEVAQILNVTREGVRQNLNKSMNKLRLLKDDEGVNNYIYRILNTKPKKYYNPRFKQLNEIMLKDLDEIEICINNKAYKSAIVLCGSVLETLLSIWLSEDSKDNKWTENDAYYIDYLGREQKIDLYRCINVIRGRLSYYYWGKSDTKNAHEIRKCRNLIHSKAIQNLNDEINKEVCEKILNKLNAIIKIKEKYDKDKE